MCCCTARDRRCGRLWRTTSRDRRRSIQLPGARRARHRLPRRRALACRPAALRGAHRRLRRLHRVPRAVQAHDRADRHADARRTSRRRPRRRCSAPFARGLRSSPSRTDLTYPVRRLFTPSSKRLATFPAAQGKTEEGDLPVLKAVRLVLVALTALLAIPAATVHAAQRMPIGFFDDPTFRWSPTRDQNLQLAAVDRRVGHPHDGHVGHDRADEAGGRGERRRPRLQADRPRRSRLPVGPLRPARDDQHHRHAEVGERRARRRT